MDLQKVLEKEQKIIKSWMSSPNPDRAIKQIIPDQRKAYLSGELHLASIMDDVHALPVELKPEIIFKGSTSSSNETIKSQSPTEDKTGTVQTTGPAVKATLKKPSPQSSKASQSQKKKNKPFPKPITSSSGKAKVSTEETILLRLESQFQSLARQVQSCNAKVRNFEATNKPVQNLKPVSKNIPKQKEKVSILSKPLKFVSNGFLQDNPVTTTTEKLPNSSQTLKGESSEPIKRWVPKSN